MSLSALVPHLVFCRIDALATPAGLLLGNSYSPRHLKAVFLHSNVGPFQTLYSLEYFSQLTFRGVVEYSRRDSLSSKEEKGLSLRQFWCLPVKLDGRKSDHTNHTLFNSEPSNSPFPSSVNCRISNLPMYVLSEPKIDRLATVS